MSAKRDGCAVLFLMAPGGAARGFREHLGTAYLRAILRRAGIASRVYLPPVNPGLPGFASALRKLRPRVVGFTVYESNLGVTRAMARVVRETLPGSVIVVGGPNATFVPDETLDLVGADACLRGAGEGTIVSLAEAILGAESAVSRLPELLRDVPNLVLSSANGHVRTAAADLSSFPAAYFRTLDDIPSPFQDGVIETPDVGYLTARGCNQSCTYCSFAAISGRRVAFHGVERVLDDLEALQALARRTRRPRGETIPICDDAFTLVPERARCICEGILERGIRLPLWCETRGDRVDGDLLRLMRRAGFTSIAFGLESAVPRVLRAIGKVRPPDATGDPQFRAEAEYLERFREAVRAAQSCGVAPHVSVIGGLPGETAADFQATLDFVTSLGVETYSHNILSLFPGTPLYEHRSAFGLNAFREPSTGEWGTVLAYPADEVVSLRHSTLQEEKWGAAQSLADSLCGRPEETEVAEDAASAVVIHGGCRSPQLAAWLRQTLAIGGSVVAFVPSKASVAGWSSYLARERVPFGRLHCLVPDRPNGRDGRGFVSATGVSAGTRLHFVSACSPDAAAPVEVNARGDCTVTMWIASAPGVRFEGLPRGNALAGPGLQIADSCRLRAGSPRCGKPRVLHVDSRGRVGACWHGPPIGAIGGSPARERTACVPPARCPLRKPHWLTRHRQSRLWDLDFASQMSWVFRGEIERSVT